LRVRGTGAGASPFRIRTAAPARAQARPPALHTWAPRARPCSAATRSRS
jgi:hypothetical protein